MPYLMGRLVSQLAVMPERFTDLTHLDLTLRTQVQNFKQVRA